MKTPREIDGIDARLIEIARRVAPLGPPASPASAVALLRAVVKIGTSVTGLEAGKEVVGSARLNLVEDAWETVRCRVQGYGDQRLVTVDGRLAVRFRPGAVPRVVGVMVLAPRRDDALEALSTTCCIDGAGRATYEWQFGRGHRLYAVRVWRQEEKEIWTATLDRELTLIESGIVDGRLALVTSGTPAGAFKRIVPAMPLPRNAVKGALPRNGLGHP
jgi:hypothetical protein